MKKIIAIIIFVCVIVICGYPEFGNKVFIFIGLMLVPPLFVWFFKKNPFFFENILTFFFENILKKLMKLIKRIALLAGKHKKKRKDIRLKKWKKIYRQEQKNN